MVDGGRYFVGLREMKLLDGEECQEEQVMERSAGEVSEPNEMRSPERSRAQEM